MLEFTEHPPRILLTDHVDGDRPIMVYRVADHAAATAELKERGWTPERSLEIPQGPVSSYRSPGGRTPSRSSPVYSRAGATSGRERRLRAISEGRDGDF